VLATLDRDDGNHLRAADTFRARVASDRFVVHNYVVVESAALIQRRLDAATVRRYFEDLLPALEIVWVDPPTHAAATAAFLAAISRRVSLVDRVSFEVMRRQRITTAFAFDDDFRRQGFETLP
jgi:predicted nucleic acid-binding protein